MDIENIKTDNIPLLDSLIYNLKKIVLGAVLKDETTALNNETISSSRKSDIYIACIEGRPRLDLFPDYLTYDFLSTHTEFPDNIISQCLHDLDNISDSVKATLLQIFSEYYISNYIEENNYYRMLNGKPDFGKEGILIPSDIFPTSIKGISQDTYVDQFSIAVLDKFDSLGIIDKLIALYPDEKYLNYLGSKSINVYNARKASNFALLYMTDDIPDVISSKFKDKFELNRVFTLKTIYSDAYKFESDYYDNFIRVFMLIQTLSDMIIELPSMIIRREVFDIRMVELMFKSNGVDFFPEIPMKYQLAMIQNLNRLIQFKSTTKNIVDICSLFGFDNITVFKYYLLKERKMDKFGHYVYNKKQIVNPNDPNSIIEVPDEEGNYDLKFLKVPIDDIADNYLHDNSKKMTYDDVIEGDDYWNGDRTYDDVKKDILDLQFNYLQSKYLSIDTVYDMTEMAFEMVYFFNMIFDNVYLEEELTVDIPYINGESTIFKFADIICYLFALGYIYNGLEDDIMNSTSKILYIKGFNFSADINLLGQYVQDKGYTLKDLGVSDFQIPTTSVLSYNQLMNIFTKNKQVYDHVVKQLTTADNKKIYDIYKKIYDSLMIEKLTFDFFKKSDGTIATTFTDFLSDRDIILYNSIMELKNMKSDEERIERITEIMSNVVYVLDEELDLDSNNYKFIFSHLPVVSAEAIKKYIYKVINFFKSYKVQLYGINTIYLFDDRLENTIKMIDEVIINHCLTKEDNICILIKSWLTDTITKEDRVKLLDKIYMSSTYWVDKFFSDNLYLKEKIKEKLVSLLYNDITNIKDNAYINSLLSYSTVINTIEKIYSSKTTSIKEEKINMTDEVYLIITQWLEKYFSTDSNINDQIKQKIVSLINRDNLDIKESLIRSNTFNFISKYTINENLNNIQLSLSKEENIKMLDNLCIEITYWIDNHFSDESNIKEEIIFSSNLYYESRWMVEETININTNKTLDDKVNIFDTIKFN